MPENPKKRSRNISGYTVDWPELERVISACKDIDIQVVKTTLANLPRLLEIATHYHIQGITGVTIFGYPLGSDGAHGMVGDDNIVHVVGPVKRQHIRIFVGKIDPKTEKQMARRDLFKTIRDQWNLLSQEEKLLYSNKAKIKHKAYYFGYQQFLSERLIKTAH